MMLTLLAQPVSEPLLVSEAKEHLRVDQSVEDPLIAGLIKSARQHCESVTRRALVSQTWKLWLDEFPVDGWPIELPLPPLRSVSSVKYLDAAGAEQTWDASNYTVYAPAGPYAERGKIVPNADVNYPTVQVVLNAVRIEFIAGYGTDADVPEALKSWILLRVGELYAHREPSVVGVMYTRTGADDMMLWPFRSWRAA